MVDHNKDEVVDAVSTVSSLGGGVNRDKQINSFHAIPPCIGRVIGDSVKMGTVCAEDMVDDPKDGNVRLTAHEVTDV